jgi:DNA-binding CsgD family transcriptional regulator
LKRPDREGVLSSRAEATRATPEVEPLAALVAKFLKRAKLAQAERREILHIAQGLASKDSAKLEGVPVELIRTRRKLIYRKLRLSGAGELVSGLLALSLTELAQRDRR